MPDIVEGIYLTDMLLWEADRNFTREVITLAAPSGTPTYKIGQVLGIKTADQKFYPCVQGASDGTQTPAAILAADTVASTAGVPALVLRRDCVVVSNFLLWDASFTLQTQKDAAIVLLKAIHIVVAAKPSM